MKPQITAKQIPDWKRFKPFYKVVLDDGVKYFTKEKRESYKAYIDLKVK